MPLSPEGYQYNTWVIEAGGAAGTWLLTLTGIALLSRFESLDGNWRRDTLVIEDRELLPGPLSQVREPPPSGNLAFRLRHWSPAATLNSIESAGNASGWAVDDVRVSLVTRTSGDDGVEYSDFFGGVEIDVAVRSGYIQRVGYNIFLSGTVVWWPGGFL